MIRVEALTVALSGQTVVRDVSFAVAPGESFGLMGESGSGKSTVLRALAGLAPRWHGRIAIDGRALAPGDPPGRLPQMQMVFQDPYGSLHPRHTVDRILREPMALRGLDRRDERVAAALGDVGLGAAHRFRYPHQLSGGQRQRVAITRALVGDPRILLLDEPTSALDVSVQAEILNLLRRQQRARGLTTILVSHDRAVLRHMCGRIGVMRGGRLSAQAPAATGTIDPAFAYDLHPS